MKKEDEPLKPPSMFAETSAEKQNLQSKLAFLRSLGSVKTKHEIDSQKLCKEVRHGS